MITIDKIRVRISDAIRQSGLSQIAIAKRLGITQQTVSHYVRGTKLPSLDTFANLCVLLGIPADELLCITKY